MKILTVYKSGGDYRPEHVEALQRQCGKYAPGVPFVCLDDDNLVHGWPGWWSKMEAFRWLGPVLYLDLSNVINGMLGAMLRIAQECDFVVNRDPSPRIRKVQSCVMAWSGDMHYLYEAFHAKAKQAMREYTKARWWGDQGFIEAHANSWQYWQDLLPNAVASYKKHWITGEIKNPVIINYHGKPKPWEAAYVN